MSSTSTCARRGPRPRPARHATLLAVLLAVPLVTAMARPGPGEFASAAGRPDRAWRPLPPAPLDRPYTVAGVWDGTDLLVAGRAATPDGAGYNVAAAYRPATGRWRRLAPPPAFTGTYPGQVGAVWTGREMLLWGAGLHAAYDPTADRWRSLPAPPAAVAGTSPGGQIVAWTGRRMIVWDGATGAGGAAYEPGTDSWHRLPPAPLSERTGATGAWTGRELVVVGGTDGGGTVLSDAAAFDPATDRWRWLPAMPEPRTRASAVWDGSAPGSLRTCDAHPPVAGCGDRSELLVVGGQGPSAAHGPTPPYPAGVAFDPATDSWRHLPAADTGRVGQRATWTGRRLLVWGGRTVVAGAEVPAPAGLAYDPGADEWSPLPAGPLAGRTDPVLAWTGRDLLVWGGRSVPLDAILTDGAAYGPST